MRQLTITILSIFFLIPHAYAGMAVDEKIPHDLSLQNQDSTVQSFDTLSGEQGLVLFFVRSVNWCPYCQRQLIDLSKRAEEFSHRGYNVAALSYDPVGSLDRFTMQHNIDNITLLSDPKSEAIKAFGLLNTDIKEGSPHYGIPNPAVVVIGRDQMVQTIHQEDGYKKRPDLDQVLRALVYIDYERRQTK